MLATSQTEHRLGSTSLAYHSRFTTKSQKKNNHPFSILFLPRKNMEKKQKNTIDHLSLQEDVTIFVHGTFWLKQSKNRLNHQPQRP